MNPMLEFFCLLFNGDKTAVKWRPFTDCSHNKTWGFGITWELL
jgi:hypothetical protein